MYLSDSRNSFNALEDPKWVPRGAHPVQSPKNNTIIFESKYAMQSNIL